MHSTNTSGASGHAATLWRLMPWLWPKGERELRRRLIFATLCMVVGKAAEVLAPIFYSVVIDLISGAEKIQSLHVGAAGLIAGYVLVRVLGGSMNAVRDVIFLKTRLRAVRAISLTVFECVVSLPMAFHIGRETGSLSRVVQRGSAGVAFVLEMLAFSILPTLIELFLALTILTWMFGPFFSFAIVVTIITYTAATAAVTEYRIKLRRRMNSADEEMHAKLVDALLNVQTVKEFMGEQRELKSYLDRFQRYEDAYRPHEVSLKLLDVLQNVIIGAGLFTIMWVAHGRVQNGSMTVGDFVLVVTYLLQLYLPLEYFGFVYRELRRSFTDVEAMFQIMEGRQAVSALPPAALSTKIKEEELGRIEFEAVTFEYETGRSIIKDVSFVVEPGTKVAIVGETGAGKSTIGRLLCGHYMPSQGRIYIDGGDIAINPNVSRSLVGVVAQDISLFNESIYYNIAYGRPGATAEEVVSAAKLAQAHNFIINLPEGYGTVVGERGLKLSGGERQRIAVARMLLKDPAIVVLDEATSAVDSLTEAELLTALRPLLGGRTVVIIAHRLSAIADVDQILVLKDGRLIEAGQRDALMQQNGVFANLWRLQLGSY